MLLPAVGAAAVTAPGTAGVAALTAAPDAEPMAAGALSVAGVGESLLCTGAAAFWLPAADAGGVVTGAVVLTAAVKLAVAAVQKGQHNNRAHIIIDVTESMKRTADAGACPMLSRDLNQP